MKADYRSGYLYVLVHPSHPDLYKIGVTILHPEKRLAQHNSQLDKHAGRIVRETGLKWELKTYIAVPDPFWAESAFWGATQVSVMPFRRGIEVERIPWKEVQAGLDAAKKAGVRPPQPPPRLVKGRAWVNAQLEGTGITLTEQHRFRNVEFVSVFQCATGHVFTERAKEVLKRRTCPCCVDWDWAEGYFGRGLRASLR